MPLSWQDLKLGEYYFDVLDSSMTVIQTFKIWIAQYPLEHQQIQNLLCISQLSLQDRNLKNTTEEYHQRTAENQLWRKNNDKNESSSSQREMEKILVSEKPKKEANDKIAKKEAKKGQANKFKENCPECLHENTCHMHRVKKINAITYQLNQR